MISDTSSTKEGSPAPLQAKLYFDEPSSFSTAERRRKLVSRLHRLQKRGVVASVDVVTWHRDPEVDGETVIGNERAAVLDRIESWTAARNCSFTPVGSPHGGVGMSMDSSAGDAVPAVMLVVSRANRFEGVFPHVRDGWRYDVTDGLELLEAGHFSPSVRERDDGGSTAPNHV